MQPDDVVLETHDISKSYGPVSALKHINLQLAGDNIYGLFGRNGAGKTTLLDILSNRIFADSGSVTCCGEDTLQHPETVARNFCYMPERNYFPSWMPVHRILSLGEKSYSEFDAAYAEKLCRQFELDTRKKFGHLSKGFQSIVKIVLGLAAKSPVTIYDEPVLGLDAVARDRFYLELIEEYGRDPRMFIISTHLIEESADLFNEAIIIKDGAVIRQASVDELVNTAFYVSGKHTAVDSFIRTRPVLSDETINDFRTVVVEGRLSEEKKVSGLTFSPLTIQKLFIHLTNDQGKQER